MEPGHEDREYGVHPVVVHVGNGASMEPGHEDREYKQRRVVAPGPGPASMEPGHEDREYVQWVHDRFSDIWPQWSPVMKTGNTCKDQDDPVRSARLNGARS